MVHNILVIIICNTEYSKNQQLLSVRIAFCNALYDGCYTCILCITGVSVD